MRKTGSGRVNLLDLLVFDRVDERIRALDCVDGGTLVEWTVDRYGREDAVVCRHCDTTELEVGDFEPGYLSQTLTHSELVLKKPRRCQLCDRWVQFEFLQRNMPANVRWIHRHAGTQVPLNEEQWLAVDAMLTFFVWNREHRLGEHPDYAQFVNDVLDLDLLQP